VLPIAARADGVRPRYFWYERGALAFLAEGLAIRRGIADDPDRGEILMKRVVVAPHDPEEFLGGTERVVEAMVRARLRRGEEIVVFAGSEKFAPETRMETRAASGLAVHKLLRPRAETGEVFLRSGIRGEFERLVAAIQPDVVEWHHGATLSLDLVRAAREQRIRTIVFLHDLWLSCPRYFRIPPAGIRCPEGNDRGACVACVGRDLPWAPPQLENWVSRFTKNAREELAAADVKIAPSRAHARRLAAAFPDLNLELRVVPHGLLDDAVRRPVPRAGAAAAGKLRIAHFGNLVPEKGIEDLAAALGKLAEPYRVSLDLYGEELSPGLVAGARALCPNVKIAYHGAYSSFAQIAERVAAADIAAFPSRAAESYGLVVDEAMSVGLPVLVSDRGALAERAGGAGVVLEAENPTIWHAAVQRLLDDPASLESLRSRVPRSHRTIEHALDEIDAL
jgi:glycosyltransferase involved in cell wall biosynthesis